MRRAVTLAAAVVMLGAATLSAQATNFSGTWTRDTTGMGAMMGGGGGGGGRPGGGGGPMSISMDAKTMTITRTQGGNEVKTVYNLDGSDSKNSQMGRGGAATEVISKAKWDGATLAITTNQDRGGTIVTRTAVYSLDASGKVLSVATTQPPRGGGDPVTMTAKYNKGM